MKKFLLLLLLGLALLAFFGLGGQELLAPGHYRAWLADHPLSAGLAFAGVYILVTALSLPGAALLTLVAGALFGLGWGLLIVSFASSIGASLAFLVSRSLLRDWVQRRFGAALKTINAGIERDGAYYLFSLRLIPLVPFFVINLVFGLVPIRLWTFYWVSQLGMLAGTAVYVNAGAQLGQLEALSLAGIMSPGLLGAFVLLGLFPWLARALMAALARARVYRGWRKPRQFDANLIVIGAGAAGLVSAYIAAAVKAKVLLIEKHRMGGDCLYTGCVPSKALIKSAAVARDLQDAAHYGLKPVRAETDWPAVMARVQAVIAQVEPHDSVARYSDLGVDCVAGEAQLLSPWQVQVGERVLSARAIIIATGARPRVPDIPGLDQIAYYSSDTIWQLRANPGRLLVLGSGPIGCELAQAFGRLGAQVTLVGRAARPLPREDAEVSAHLAAVLADEGVRLLNGARAMRFAGQTLHCETDQGAQQLEFDTLLLALGRQPNVQGFGAERLGLTLTDSGALQVDERLRTRFPNILACGDVAGPYQFTHMASHQAWYAAVNGLFGRFKSFAVDYRVVPWATFTAPEVARVGLSEAEARAQGVDYEVSRYDLSELDRAIADGAAAGFVKVLTVPGRDRILGAVVVGYRASELIGSFISAMKQGRGLNDILATIHVYPTVLEANKYVAGVWKRAHAPVRLLNGLARFHRWWR